METSDYLGAIGRRAWIVILVPLLAAGVAFGIVSAQGKVTRSTAVVLAHPDVSDFGSNVGYVTAFQGAMSSLAVLDSVSKTTGVSVSDLRAGLTAKPTAANSITFDVRYSGRQSGATVVQVPVAAGQSALRVLTGPTVATAQAQVDDAQAAIDSAKQAISDFSSSTGIYAPSQDYTALSSQLAQLRVTEVQNEASNSHPYNASVLAAKIATTSAQLKKLAPQVVQFGYLQDASDRAQSSLQSAQAALSANRQVASVAATKGGVIAGAANPVSRVNSGLKAAGTAAIVALILSIGVITLLEGRAVAARNASRHRSVGTSAAKPETSSAVQTVGSKSPSLSSSSVGSASSSPKPPTSSPVGSSSASSGPKPPSSSPVASPSAGSGPKPPTSSPVTGPKAPGSSSSSTSTSSSSAGSGSGSGSSSSPPSSTRA